MSGSSAIEALFALLSGARNKRIFHPDGTVFRATLEVERTIDGVPLFEEGTATPAVVRFSRGLGTPRGRLDFLGLALHVGDVQDILLASSMPARVGRHLPLPARTFAGTTFSTLLPFRLGTGTGLVGARVDHPPAAADDQLDAIVAAADAGALSVALAIARPCERWGRFATVAIDARDPLPATPFDPWNCAEGIAPLGWVNALRAPAYRGSRRGRGA